MGMNYQELDDKTREYMLSEFEKERESAEPYQSKALSTAGLSAFPNMMRTAINEHDEEWLARTLNNPDLWEPTETYERKGVQRTRRRNIRQAAQRLALTEFSTWYVTGFARRLLDEDEEKCEVYRGAQPKWEPGECAEHEGAIVSVQEIYDNHRARYWPEPGDESAFSIPFGPGCHHLIRRINS